VLSLPAQSEQRAQQDAVLRALLALARVPQPQAELPAVPLRRAQQWELVSAQQPPVEQQAEQPQPEQVLPASESVLPQEAVRRAQLPREVQPQEQPEPQAPGRLALPDASEPLSPLLPSLAYPPQLSPRRPLLRPRRREGACEPSRPRPRGSSWSASSFLERRTRAAGR
jgi:hypothetical protein